MKHVEYVYSEIFMMKLVVVCCRVPKISFGIPHFLRDMSWFRASWFGSSFLLANSCSHRWVAVLKNTLLCYLQVCWWRWTSHRNAASVTWTINTWTGLLCAASLSSTSWSLCLWTGCTSSIWWCSSVSELISALLFQSWMPQRWQFNPV